MPPSDLSFNENPSQYTHHKEAGLIAQELLDTDVSFCVFQNENEDLSSNAFGVDYNSIFTYSIEAI